jgi:hypothetical protein
MWKERVLNKMQKKKIMSKIFDFSHLIKHDRLYKVIMIIYGMTVAYG